MDGAASVPPVAFVQFGPRNQLPGRAPLVLVAAVHDDEVALSGGRAQLLPSAAAAVEQAGGCRGAGLRLDEAQAGGVFDHQVGFRAVAVAVEEAAARDAAVHAVLDDLGRHPRLEDRAAQRVRTQLLRRADMS